MKQSELFVNKEENIKEDTLDFNHLDKSFINSLISTFDKQIKTQQKNNGEFFTKNEKLLEELEYNINLNKERFCFVDPSCGSGDILLHFIKKYIKHWKNKKSIDNIIENIFYNFYVFDINPTACLITKYRIYIVIKEYFEKSVIDNYNFNGLNIYCLDFTLKESIKKYLHLFDSKNYKELNREIAKLYKINDEELNYIVIYNQKVEGEK